MKELEYEIKRLREENRQLRERLAQAKARITGFRMNFVAYSDFVRENLALALVSENELVRKLAEDAKFYDEQEVDLKDE